MMKRFSYNLFYALFSFLFTKIYSHKVVFLEKLPSGPLFLAANHISYFDPPLVGISLKEEICYLARKTLFSNRFFAALISSLNAYPVDQEHIDLTFMKSVKTLVNQKQKILIFPEGERSETGTLTELKTGACYLALHFKIPIVPTYIQGAFELWPIHKRLPRLKGKTCVIFGKALLPENYSHLRKKEAAIHMTEDLRKAFEDLKNESLKLS